MIARPLPHDDRKGRRYYTRMRRPVKLPGIVAATLAVVVRAEQRFAKK